MAEVVAVAKRSRQLLRRKGDESLIEVLDAAATTQPAAFAAGLRGDLPTVQAALDTWTTSLVNGR